MASNDRRNPFTGATAWEAINAEPRTIAEFDQFPGIYGFQLLERPRQESLVLYEPGSGGRIFTLVNTAPNVGQARVDYNSGICQFNIADNGLPVFADYDGGGSPTNIENISSIATFTGRTTDDLDEGTINKYFSGKDSDDLPEGATNLFLTSGNLGGTINAATSQATPNDSGKIGFWDATASALRQLTFTQLKAFLKTYFDTLYEAVGATLGIIGLTEETDIDIDADYLPIYSDSASANRRTNVSNLLANHPGVAKAWVNFDGATAANVSGTYSRTGTTVTVTLANHGYIVGNIIYADITSGSATDGLYTITSVTQNTFTYTEGGSGSTSGNVTLLRRLIRDSHNIHSVTYGNSAGRYHVNFSNVLSVDSAVSLTVNDWGVELYSLTSGRTTTAHTVYSNLTSTVTGHNSSEVNFVKH
jgi:hypothetical protein